MCFDQAGNFSCDEGPQQGLHLSLIGVRLNWCHNGPWLAGCLAQHHLAGVSADFQRGDLGLGERQDLSGLSSGDDFRALLGEFDEIEVSTEPCKYSCEEDCRPITRHGLTDDAVSARPGGR